MEKQSVTIYTVAREARVEREMRAGACGVAYTRTCQAGF